MQLISIPTRTTIRHGEIRIEFKKKGKRKEVHQLANSPSPCVYVSSPGGVLELVGCVSPLS